MSRRLDPCPWCGVKPTYIRFRLITDTRKDFGNYCCSHLRCPVMPHQGGMFTCAADARKAWNWKEATG